MKKTNTRVHRNGGSKTASPQVPNKPESARARASKTGQRFEGIVKAFNAELGFGFITIAPELATKLKLKPAQDLYFHTSALPEGKAALLRAGAKVSFVVETGDKGPRAVAIQMDEKQQAETARAIRERGARLQCLILGNERTEDCIWASPEGQLYFWDGGLDREPREITFDIAREWLKKFCDPNFEFASPYFKEDTAAARLVDVAIDNWRQRQAEAARKLAPPNLEDAVRESAALAVLLTSHIMHSEGQCYTASMGDDIFNYGLMRLCDRTNNRLLGAFYGRKGGAQ